MLNAQLRTRHATTASSSPSAALPALTAETEDEAAAVVAQRHDAVSALATRPITHDEMRDALGAVRRALNATPFGLSSYQEAKVEGSSGAPQRLSPLVLNALLANAGVVKLNHVETKVSLLKDFVGNEMFVAE